MKLVGLMPVRNEDWVLGLSARWLVLTIFSIGLQAATYTATTCSQADVQTAITNELATPADGDIISIPAGTCTWTGISGVSGTFTHSVTIQGAGAVSSTSGGASTTGSDSTVIIDNISSTPDLAITTTSGKSFRLTGVFVQQNGSSTRGANGGIVGILGTSSSVRVDHCHFYVINGGVGLRIDGSELGVADHNFFDNASGSLTNDLAFHNGEGWNGSSSSDFGDHSWADTDHFGTASFFFAEDNRFNNGDVGDGHDGARYVLRHNTVTGDGNSAQQMYNHGLTDARGRATRAAEVYQNSFTQAIAAGNPVYSLNSGTLLFWGNTVNQYKGAVEMDDTNKSNATYSYLATPNGWGYCGTAQTGSSSAWDQNTNSSGYACLDQPARGAGDLLNGLDFPSALDSVTATITWPHQALSPVYIWNNNYTNPYAGKSIVIVDFTPLTDNVDYYQQFGTFGETGSFNGAAGVGQGLLSARPSTCTAGVGYWATDTNTLYTCNSGGNAWTAYYTPYFYPHPLAAPASVSITNLGSVIQSTPFVPAISLTNGSGNAAAFICVYMNGLSVQPNHCATSAPWNVNVFDGIPGDGQAQFQAVAYDYAWNILASSTIYTQQIRLNGLNNSIGSLPTSGSATLTPVQWNGHNFGGACGGFTQFDGRENQGTDDTWTGTSCGGSGQVQGTFKSYRLPNGLHGVHFAFNGDGMGTQFGGDPYIVGNTFTSGSVSGSNITLTSPQQQWLVTNRPVAFSSTGTLPTDSGTSAPLLTGYLYCTLNQITGMASTTCPTNLISSASVTNPTISITLSSMPGGLTAGVSKVNLHRFTTSASSSNTGICDGLYTIATIVSLTFTVTAPNCPTGSWGGSTGVSGTEVIINPYFANYVDNNTATFSYTPGGAALSMSSGGSGTHTVSYRMRPAYWGTLPFDIFDGYPVGFAYNTVVTANGAHSMELRPPYNYVHLCLTPTATCPSSISLAPKIANTDGSFTTIAANSVTYPYVDDGGFTSVASVNSTTGVITASNVGWGIVTETCATCDSGSSLPAVPITVQVENNATFAHFSKTSGVLTSYTPGQSFPPMGWWFMDPIYATTFQSDPTQRLSWMGPLMNDSGITAAVASAGPPPSIYDPNNTSCNSALTSADTLLQGFSQTYHIAMGYDFENIEYPAIYEGAIANATGYNRLTCLTNYISNLAALGTVHALDGVDEISARIANLFANPTTAIGSANFTGPIVVSGGTATATTLQNIYATWNQSTGQGSAVFYAGATNACLNGWHLVASITTNGSGQTTAYTFATTCGNGTYNASTDASLTQRYLWSFPYIGGSSGAGGTLACVLPKFVGTNHASYQTWSQILDDSGNVLGSDASLTSLVSSGTVLTVNYTGNAIPNGASVHIMAATNTALNTVGIVSNAATNSFTIPTTATSGTYTSSTDAGLTLSVDCALPNNYFTQIYSAVHAGANIPIFQPILGTTYGNTTAVKGWNASNLSDGSLLYHASQCPASLGDDCSTWSTVYNSVGGVAVTNLNSRAFQSAARRDLVFAGIQYLRLHTGYLFDPIRDKPNSVYWRPETFISRLEWDKTNGISGYKMNWFQSNNAGQYAIATGLLVGGQALGPEYPTDHVWAAISRDFRLSATEQKYWLQPRGASPYLGPMLPTAVTYGPYGNSLKVVCLADVPLNISGTTQSPSAYAQTIDLSKINISGGREYKNIINGLTSYYVALVGNPTSDATDPCAAPGQVTTYYAQPPGVASDLQTYVFPQPTAFPGGATAAAVVVSEYPRLTMYDPVVPCTSTGCPVPAVVPFWWHYRYADASGNIVGEGTPVERIQ